MVASSVRRECGQSCFLLLSNSIFMLFSVFTKRLSYTCEVVSVIRKPIQFHLLTFSPWILHDLGLLRVYAHFNPSTHSVELIEQRLCFTGTPRKTMSPVKQRIHIMAERSDGLIFVRQSGWLSISVAKILTAFPQVK
ncbi:hypothetical protein KIN20_031369 [Parelaphostrongylus tenuis]|uniref:Uncharacterized protein n=1 Tax=Parelaphostrongylus tenuis TaxID=148309 RepID=A0AAD5WH75_PARTN|nr:hypothetical protein KIN20_031369 [Parelaphostrongylus tenuis]